MVKLKKKILSPKEVVNKINQIVADSEGISLKEYKRRQKIRDAASKEYAKTHWVSDLTHAQKYFIATTQDKEPYSYMGKNLSRSNTQQLNTFKQHNKNYLAFINTQKTLKNLVVPQETINKLKAPLEPLKKLQDEYQAIGRKLRMQLPSIPLGMGLQSLLNPFDLRGLGIPPDIKVKGLLHDFEETNKVEKSHGLNTLMKRHGMKSPIEIADYYLNIYEDLSKVDYVVDSFENVVALCNAVGVLPKTLFIELCKHIKVSKTRYKEDAFIAHGIAIEELINAYDTLCKTRQAKTTMTLFFNSKARKEWSKKYRHEWKEYKRFNEDFPRWLKIFKARAERAESDFDMMATFAEENKRGK